VPRCLEVDQVSQTNSWGVEPGQVTPPPSGDGKIGAPASSGSPAGAPPGLAEGDSTPASLDRHQVALRLQRLASRLEDGGDRVRLLDLAGAVLGGPSEVVWRNFSPLQAFDDALIADQLVDTGRSPLGLVSWIETIRNGLIFVPVLVTWWVIASAVGAYQQLLTAQPGLAQWPFLYLWQTGFRGQTPWTLGLLATIDAGVILLLVALTVVASFMQEIRQSERERTVEGERRAVRGVLADAAYALAAGLPPDIMYAMKRLDEVVRALLADLQADRDKWHSMQEGMARQTSDLMEATTQLRHIAQDLSGTVRSLTELIPRIDHHLQTISESQTLIAPILSDLRQATIGLTANVTRLLEQQAADLRTSTRTLSEAAQGSQAAALQLKELVTTIVERQDRLLAALDAAHQGEDHAWRIIASSLQEFEQALRAAATYAQAMYGVSVDVREVANALPTVAADFRQQIQVAADAQVQAAAALTRSVGYLDRMASRDRPVGDGSLGTVDGPRGRDGG
jgi:ABC-type transporter Mla subunit MlaD